MSLKDKLQKIKESRIFSTSEEEKTGVMNALILLSAALGALGLSHDAHADACTDTVNEWNNGMSITSKADWMDNWANWGDWCDWGDWDNWGDGNNV